MPTQQPSQQHQPLQGDQCSNESDEIYEDLTMPELTEDKHELGPVINVHAQQRNTNQTQELIQGDDDELNQGMKMKGAELDNIKAAIKKMKMALVVTVIINIVLLLLVTVIIGSIQSQSKFGQQMDKSEFTELIALIQNNISMQLDTINSDISQQIVNLQTQVSDLHPCGLGEWYRVAYLNMSDPTQQCPSAWREYDTGGVRACGRPSTSGGSCPATTYSINFQYRRVCGRVVGYQYGSPDGFLSGNINLQYVDGVSITRGSPRQHVWTYAAGLTDNSSDYTDENCPCSSTPGSRAPSFVGNCYYCESGNPSSTWSYRLYTGDKLWDGLQCEGSCCAGTDTLLWFNVQLSNTTSNNIEIRICGNEGTSDEDTPVELIEIYAAQ